MKKEIAFEYKVIGIRASADVLLNEIITQGRSATKYSFDGFLEKLTSGQYSEESARIIHGRSLSHGEIGCARSHQLAYESVLAVSDWVIFLEDDMRVVGHLSMLEEKIAKLPDSPTLVLFENGPDKVSILPRRYRRSRSHSYALNRKALDVVNTTQAKIMTVADWPIQWAFLLDFAIVNQESVALRESQESLIQAGRAIEVHKQSKSFSLMRKVWPIRMLRILLLLKKEKIERPVLTSFYSSRSGMY